MRGLKMYEKEFGLAHLYGKDWSWSTSDDYDTFRSVYDNTISDKEFKGKPKDCSSTLMTREQVNDLLDLSLFLSKDQSLPFRERLLHKMRRLMLSLLRYGCLRARADVANILKIEITQISDDMLDFQMKRDYKSHKITADKKVVLKPSRFVVGAEDVQILNEIIQHHPSFTPEEIAEEVERVRKVKQDTTMKARTKQNKSVLLFERLWLRPLNNVQPNNQVWFAKMPVGEHFAADAVKEYIPTLLQTSSHFSGCENQKFTNTSIRKSHNDALVDAEAPLVIQQESLAQNTKAYAKGPSHPINKLKVAEVISGKRTQWNEELVHPPHHQTRLPFKKRAFQNYQQGNKENLNIQNHPTADQSFTFSFSKGDAKFDFSFRL